MTQLWNRRHARSVGRDTGTRPSRLGRAMASTLLVGALVAACEDGDGDEGTQPAPGVSSFEQGRFDDLPLPTEAEPVGLRSEQEGIVTRSYEVPDMLPADVIEFYEQALDEQGWTVRQIEELPQGVRGDWEIEGYDLRVSANEAPGLDAPGSQPGTQLSLVLSPSSATTVPGGDG